MTTQNFEILRNYAPDLFDIAGFAEMYVYTDPASSAVKLRILIEQMVLHIFDCLNIPLPKKPKLHDLLEEPNFQHVTPLAVRYKLDAVRIHGNDGAHGKNITEETSLWLLREAFQVMCWFFLTYLCDENKSPCPEYQAPPREPVPLYSRSINLHEDWLDDEIDEYHDLELNDDLDFDHPDRTSVSANQIVLPELKTTQQTEPLADLQSMLTRESLRNQLGKKQQSAIQDQGQRAVAILHLDEDDQTLE